MVEKAVGEVGGVGGPDNGNGGADVGCASISGPVSIPVAASLESEFAPETETYDPSVERSLRALMDIEYVTCGDDVMRCRVYDRGNGVITCDLISGRVEAGDDIVDAVQGIESAVSAALAGRDRTQIAPLRSVRGYFGFRCEIDRRQGGGTMKFRMADPKGDGYLNRPLTVAERGRIQAFLDNRKIVSTRRRK